MSFDALAAFLTRIPAVEGPVNTRRETDGTWWVELVIDVQHPLAWQTVQELGHVLNFISVEKRLPTIFKPISPPPYLNGGPKDFLSWVIEAEHPDFTPDRLAAWLEGRLPRPVDDLAQWQSQGPISELN